MEWKESASAVAQATENARCCRNCMHSEPVHGSDQFRLMCSNRSGYRGLWYLVGTDDVCARFRQAIDAAVLPPGARAVPLSQGRFPLVDEADYADMIRYSWCVKRMGGRKPGNHENFYAMRTIISRTTKVKRSVLMHRATMGAKPGQVVDHINHNGLDNRYF